MLLAGIEDIQLVALDANMGPSTISNIVAHCVDTKTESKSFLFPLPNNKLIVLSQFYCSSP